ncbi:ABC transporter substrate-binding protein [Kribbella sp. NPDC055071]
MKLKLMVPAAITALAATLSLSACGNDSESSAGGPVTLTLWTGFTGGDRTAYEGLVKTFNATHENLKVTMEVQPWDTIAQKLPSSWATGQGPDLATPNFDPNVLSKYEASRSLLPLDIDTSGVAPAAVDAFKADGKLYAVPANIATVQLYYNKKLFAAAGIKQPPTTVAEFKADTAKLKGNGVFGLSLADHETIQMWPILQWLDGADIVDDKGCSVLDTDANKKSLGDWSKLVKDGAAPLGLTGAESDSLFSSGKAAMQLNGPWAASGYTKAGIDVGIAPVPVGVNGPVTLASTAPLSASAKTKHPKEAQEFLSWWIGKTAQKQFALASGFPPVRTDLGGDAELKANKIVATFAAGLPSARLYLPGVTDATQVDSEAYVPLIGEITRGEDVDKAVSKASDAIDKITGCQR